MAALTPLLAAMLFGALSFAAFAAFKSGPIDLCLCDFCVSSLMHELVGEECSKNAFGLQVELHKAHTRNVPGLCIYRSEVEYLASNHECFTAVSHGQ